MIDLIHEDEAASDLARTCEAYEERIAALEAENERLRTLVRAAFAEGWESAEHAISAMESGAADFREDYSQADYWEDSDSRQALEQSDE